MNIFDEIFYEIKMAKMGGARAHELKVKVSAEGYAELQSCKDSIQNSICGIPLEVDYSEGAVRMTVIQE